MRIPLSIRHLVMASVIGATGCCESYIEPAGISVEQLAVVTGAVRSIDGRCVPRHREVRVTPGIHMLDFGGGDSGLGFRPVSAPGLSMAAMNAMNAATSSAPSEGPVRLTVDLHSGHRYEFTVKGYLNGTRLTMHNVTTQRKTYFDPTRWVFYDEANQPIPRPQGPYSP